ncbi:MAG: endonuclease/exonuclease/phosphatase family protein [Elusimicrobia bacterium]|nr:endonuclease/exonuclease/phosphatase family protein [Elusimicrobiota bacterium]
MKLKTAAMSLAVAIWAAAPVFSSEPAPSIKILTYNVGGIPWIMPLPKRRARFAEISRRLRDSSYDIVCLQEIWTAGDARRIWKESGFAHMARLKQALPFGNGLMILSRYPLGDVRVFPFTAREPSRYFLDDEFWAKKGALAVRIDVAGRQVDVYNTHLIASTEDDRYIALRNTQIFDLRSVVREYSGERPFVIAGDFNFPPRQKSYRILKSLLGVHDVCPDGQPGACGATNTDGRVDQIYTSLHFAPQDIMAHGVDFRWDRPYPLFQLSDHQGATAQISLAHLSPPRDQYATFEKSGLDEWWALGEIKRSLWQNLKIVSNRAAVSMRRVSPFDFLYLAYFGRRYGAFWSMDRQIVLALGKLDRASRQPIDRQGSSK